jgi:hypothetical protein
MISLAKQALEAGGHVDAAALKEFSPLAVRYELFGDS